MVRRTSRSVLALLATDIKTVKAIAAAFGLMGGVGNPTLTARSSMWIVSSIVRFITIIAKGPDWGGIRGR